MRVVMTLWPLWSVCMWLGGWSRSCALLSSLQVPRPLAMKKESIQTRKRKPKMPKNKTSSGGESRTRKEG